MSFDEVIAQCRALFDMPPTAEVWRTLRDLLAACEPARQEDAVDYVAASCARWWDPTRDEVAPLPARMAGDVPGMWLCTPSNEDWLALAHGRYRPTQRLTRWLALDCAAHETLLEGVLGRAERPNLPHLAHLSLLASEREEPPRLCGALAMHPCASRLRSLSMPVLPIPQSIAMGRPDHQLVSLRHVELLECSRMDDATLRDSADALFEARWWSQIEGLACGTLHPRPGGARTTSVYPSLEASLWRLPRLRGVLLSDSFGLETLCEGPLLRQVTQVRLHLRHDPRAVMAIMGRLGEDPEHTVRELDLSLLSWDRLQRAEHDAAQIEGIACWLKAGAHARRLDALIVSARLLEPHHSAAHPMLIAALRDAAHTSNIRLVAAPR